VDGQCDKLVTVVGHQFITLNVHICVQHGGREASRRTGLSETAETCSTELRAAIFDGPFSRAETLNILNLQRSLTVRAFSGNWLNSTSFEAEGLRVEKFRERRLTYVGDSEKYAAHFLRYICMGIVKRT